MEAFSTFSLSSSESIFGGDLKDTHYSGGDGQTGGDVYDTANDRIVYVD
jgi:hypothetical protein